MTKTAEACCELCAENPKCEAFCWYSTDRSTGESQSGGGGESEGGGGGGAGTQCHLHSSFGGRWSKPAAARVSGQLRK